MNNVVIFTFTRASSKRIVNLVLSNAKETSKNVTHAAVCRPVKSLATSNLVRALKSKKRSSCMGSNVLI